jgi:hypothetical protein
MYLCGEATSPKVPAVIPTRTAAPPIASPVKISDLLVSKSWGGVFAKIVISEDMMPNFTTVQRYINELHANMDENSILFP